MTIVEVSRFLCWWGRVIADGETTSGWQAKSPTALAQEIGVVGLNARSDAYLFDQSRNISYPPALMPVIEAVDSLTLPQKLAVRIRYAQAGGEIERRQAAGRFGLTWSGYTSALHRAKHELAALL